MIPFEKALEIVLQQSLPLAGEQVPLAGARGRFLKNAPFSPIDSPPFDKSAMDGYAVGAGVRESYRVRGTVAAGDRIPEEPLQPGEAVKIMTGAPLPPGTDRIIRVEFTTEPEEIPGEGTVIRVIRQDDHHNRIERGENLRIGEELMPVCRLGSKEVGALAAAGIDSVDAYKKIRVGIISTGSELRPAGSALEPGQIYDSNTPQLIAQIEEAGADALSYGIIPDDRTIHAETIARGLRECSVLLLSGGVSKGDYDYVPEVLASLNAEILFHGIRVKPGRPTLFARTENTLVFGLPGNPVSVFVLFETLVKPLLCKLQSVEYPGTVIRGKIAEPLKRRDPERTEFYPAALGSGTGGTVVTPLRYGGSSHLNALCAANALIMIPAGTAKIGKGDWVDARLL